MPAAFACAGASIRSMIPSPTPAHRTGRAAFLHPALRQDSPRSTRRGLHFPASQFEDSQLVDPRLYCGGCAEVSQTGATNELWTYPQPLEVANSASNCATAGGSRPASVRCTARRTLHFDIPRTLAVWLKERPQRRTSRCARSARTVVTDRCRPAPATASAVMSSCCTTRSTRTRGSIPRARGA